MLSVERCREKYHFGDIFRWIKNKIIWRKAHPDYFDPDGLAIFVGPQGSGKTLSAVNYVYQLMEYYPDCKLVTNVELRDYPVVSFESFCAEHLPETLLPDVKMQVYLKVNRVFPFLDNDDFQKYGNGQSGVIFLVDEIQLYMNSLESKNINIDVVTQISQQRKQRKHIVATSQVFGRMAKPLREQFSAVVLCKNYFGFLQNNALIDRDSLEDDDSTGTNLTGTVKARFVWVHRQDMYDRYDTSSVVERGKWAAGEAQLPIYQEGGNTNADRLSDGGGCDRGVSGRLRASRDSVRPGR